MSRKWTHHEDTLFHTMWKAGMSYADMAQQLNRTPGSLDHRRKDLAFAPRPQVEGLGLRPALKSRGLMEPHRGRKWISKTDKPVGYTFHEASQAFRDEQACDMHWIDLHRSFGGGDSYWSKCGRHVKAPTIDAYKAAHELNIPHERDGVSMVYTAQQPASYCGSPAALCGGY
jgi:hypothetical protein